MWPACGLALLLLRLLLLPAQPAAALVFYLSNSCPGPVRLYVPSEYDHIAAAPGAAYSPGVVCSVILESHNTVNLTLTSLATGVNLDNLTIYDGSTASGTPLALVSGLVSTATTYRCATPHRAWRSVMIVMPPSSLVAQSRVPPWLVRCRA